MKVSSDTSITQWIAELKEGDPEAARRLSERFFDRLVYMARRRLGTVQRRVSDEEDIALSVLRSLCSGAERGHFPSLANRNDLWALLLTITQQKVVDQKRHQTRKKRGGFQVRGESIFIDAKGDGTVHGFDQFIGDQLTPEYLTTLEEEHQRLLNALRDDTHRHVAVWRMEGFTNQEIANKLGIGVKAVERKLRNIRAKWSQIG